MIGRKRKRAASSAAALADQPCWYFINAYSTIKIAFLLASPNNVTNPIWKYTSLVRPAIHTEINAPNVPKGSASITESGKDQRSYKAARMRKTIMAAIANARPVVPELRFS